VALADRVVAVPGATGAAGRAAVAAFAAEGCKLGLIGTDMAKLATLAADLGLAHGRWHGAAGDVTQADDVRRVVGEITNGLGPVDVMVHVVGGWLGGTPAVELDPADVATSFDQHVFSTLHMVQSTVPGMVERGWGRIFAISQPLASEPGPRGGGYLMAKAAQEVMLRSLARDLAGSGVTANLLIVKTIDKDHERDTAPTTKNAQWTTPEEIAAAMVVLCGDAAATINGARIPLFGR
jgi:NAD(P)-dependent dehydrogenase (short-subunit alcohol dehydrogenase family)